METIRASFIWTLVDVTICATMAMIVCLMFQISYDLHGSVFLGFMFMSLIFSHPGIRR